MYTDQDVHENKTFQNLAWSSGTGRVISKLVTFMDAVLTLLNFLLDETIVNTYFLVPFYWYSSGELIHCLKISIRKK